MTTGGEQPSAEVWASFIKKFAAVLKERDVGDLLTLQSKKSGDWIQFATEKRSFRIEVKSNFFRNDDDQLSFEQVIGLAAIGWSAPTGTPEESTPENDIYGSPNFFVDVKAPLKQKFLEVLIGRTFVEIFGVSEPDALAYEGYDGEGNSLLLADLGLKTVTDNTDQHPELSQAVLDVMKEITSISDLTWDNEGDLGPLNFKSIRCYVRVVEDSKYIRFYAPLLMDVEATRALLHKVNELNTVYGFMHLSLMPTGSLMAVSDVLSTPLVESHMAQALSHFMQIADEFAIELEAEFGCNEATASQQFH